MKTSTGRDANVKHSTGSDETMTKKARRGHPHPRTSTGEQSTITHFTGRLFDLKREDEAEIEAEEQAIKHKPPQAA